MKQRQRERVAEAKRQWADAAATVLEALVPQKEPRQLSYFPFRPEGKCWACLKPLLKGQYCSFRCAAVVIPRCLFDLDKCKPMDIGNRKRAALRDIPKILTRNHTRRRRARRVYNTRVPLPPGVRRRAGSRKPR